MLSESAKATYVLLRKVRPKSNTHRAMPKKQTGITLALLLYGYACNLIADVVIPDHGYNPFYTPYGGCGRGMPAMFTYVWDWIFFF